LKRGKLAGCSGDVERGEGPIEISDVVEIGTKDVATVPFSNIGKEVDEDNKDEDNEDEMYDDFDCSANLGPPATASPSSKYIGKSVGLSSLSSGSKTVSEAVNKKKVESTSSSDSSFPPPPPSSSSSSSSFHPPSSSHAATTTTTTDTATTAAAPTTTDTCTSFPPPSSFAKNNFSNMKRAEPGGDSEASRAPRDVRETLRDIYLYGTGKRGHLGQYVIENRVSRNHRTGMDSPSMRSDIASRRAFISSLQRVPLAELKSIQDGLSALAQELQHPNN